MSNETTAATPRRSKRLLLILAVIVLLVVALSYAAHWWNLGRYLQSTDDAYVGGDITVINGKVPGYIGQVAVQDNQKVKAGDLLIKLDDRDYQAALQQAQGAVVAQQATLVNLQATRRLQDAVILSAQAAVSSAEAEAQRASADSQRYKSLSGSQAISVQSWQQADATNKQAQASVQKNRADVLTAQRQVAVIDAQVQQAQGSLTQALANLRMAELNLSYTELRAPVDGYVGNRSAQLGAFAPAGSQLLVIVPAQGLWVDANFKESQLAHMKLGQAVQVEADVLPGHIFHGQVGSIAPATGSEFSVIPSENATGNFTKIVQRVPVRVLLDSKDSNLHLLRPGLSVVAEVNEQP